MIANKNYSVVGNSIPTTESALPIKGIFMNNVSGYSYWLFFQEFENSVAVSTWNSFVLDKASNLPKIFL